MDWIVIGITSFLHDELMHYHNLRLCVKMQLFLYCLIVKIKGKTHDDRFRL